MPRHQDKDVSFDPPSDWTDRTVVAFTAPPAISTKPAAAPNMVMTREDMRAGDTLRTHADRQLIELGKALEDFDLLESRETELGGQPAILLRYTWISQIGQLEQAMTLVQRPGENGPVATVFTTTMTPDDASRARPIFANILQSVRFDAGTRPGQGPTTIAPSMPPPRSTEDTPFVPMPGTRGPTSRR